MTRKAEDRESVQGDVDETLADAFRQSCLAELRAPKAGNVHIFADGHRMTVADFEKSASVAAPHMARIGATVGQRVLGAMRATMSAVGSNTNLGILLLSAPLMVACEKGGTLRQSLSAVLGDLTLKDAEDVFAAIRLASPGGLGRVDNQDVAAPPSVDLREAMRSAAARDRIARQYVTDFADIFNIGLPIFQSSVKAGLDEADCVTKTYFGYAATLPDTHVQRKHGEAIALEIMKEFQVFDLREPGADHDRILAFDRALKDRNINPGTSADLTVATVLAERLDRIRANSARG